MRTDHIKRDEVQRARRKQEKIILDLNTVARAPFWRGLFVTLGATVNSFNPAKLQRAGKISPPLGYRKFPRCLFDRKSCSKKRLLIEGPSDQLQAKWQTRFR